MATFDPTIPIGFETDLKPNSGKKLTIMDDNTYSIHSLSSQEIVSGKIACVNLTEAQKDAVMGFYATNKDVTFEFGNPADGETYNLDFVDPPPYPRILQEYQPTRWNIDLHVVGTKQ